MRITVLATSAATLLRHSAALATRPITMAATGVPAHPTATAAAVARYGAVFGSASDVIEGVIRGKTGEHTLVELTRSVRDIDEDRRRTFTYTSTLGPGYEWGSPVLACAERPKDVSAVITSPSGNRSVRIVKVDPAKGEAYTCLEVWEGSGLVARVPASELHEGVMASSATIGGFSWNRDENKVVYVAEKKPPPAASYFKPGGKAKKEGGAAEGAAAAAATPPSVRGGEFDYRDDWGEKLVHTDRQVLYVFDLTAQTITELPGVPEDVTPAQPLFVGAGAGAGAGGGAEAVVYTAYKESPRKLGLIYCYQRPCSLMHAPLGSDGPHANLTPNDAVAFSPRLNNAGDAIAYLGTSRAFDTHVGAIDLKLLDLGRAVEEAGAAAAAAAATDADGDADTPPTPPPAAGGGGVRSMFLNRFKGSSKDKVTSEAGDATVTGASRVLVAAVDEPSEHVPDGFPGIWTFALPSTCWTADDATIWLTSFVGSRSTAVAVTVSTGAIDQVTSPAFVAKHITQGGGAAGPHGDWLNGGGGAGGGGDEDESEEDEEDGGGGGTSKGGAGWSRRGSVVTRLSELKSLTPGAFWDLQPQASVTVLSALAGGGALCAWSEPTSPGGVGVILLAGESEDALPVEAVEGSEKATEAAPAGKGGWAPPGAWKWSSGPSLGPQVVTSAAVEAGEDASAAMAARGALREMSWRLLAVNPAAVGDDEELAPFEAILIMPPGMDEEDEAAAEGVECEKRGLIVIPHGGPHSVTPTVFVPSYAFLAIETNCAVLHVNYRGSIGFGRAPLNTLPGKCGSQDVADMVTATKAALAMCDKSIDPERVAVVGGSHGGFLGAHLIGQHPELYKVAGLRNPVTNIASMAGVTDIPDWCHIEAKGLGSYDFNSYLPADAESLGVMFSKSPAAHVANVKSPCLLAVGAKDLRVPPSQSVEYYQTLRAKGVPARMLMYPEDSHPLDRPATEANHWLNIAAWIEHHM